MLVSPSNYSFPLVVVYSAFHYTCTKAGTIEMELGGYNSGKIPE